MSKVAYRRKSLLGFTVSKLSVHVGSLLVRHGSGTVAESSHLDPEAQGREN